MGGPSRPPIQLIVLWLSALVSAALGAWVLFDGAWGVNTVVWATVAMIGLLLCAAGGAGVSPALALAATLGVAIAGVTALTANGTLHGWTALALVVLLAVTSKLAEDGRSERIGWSFIVRAPLSAAVRFLGEAMRRAAHLAARMAAERSQGWMRGALLALPVVVVFGLLLANADPVFATLRRSLEEVLRRWDFLPRLTFFGVLFVASLGAGGLALRGSTASAPISPPPPCPCLGRTERLVVLGAVAGLFGVFLLLQLTYLFGNAPAVAGSGITFAEYARRGFNELTIVATLCALLLMALDRHAQRSTREGAVRRVAWALVAETLLLLVSAFRRVWLYEDAYGFTTTRLYAQTYMIVMALVLAAAGVGAPRGRRHAAARPLGRRPRRAGVRDTRLLEPRGVDRADERRAGRPDRRDGCHVPRPRPVARRGAGPRPRTGLGPRAGGRAPARCAPGPLHRGPRARLPLVRVEPAAGPGGPRLGGGRARVD